MLDYIDRLYFVICDHVLKDIPKAFYFNVDKVYFYPILGSLIWWF
jgi:hypothetical protein